MKYYVLEQETAELLAQAVREMAADGWVPQGGVCVTRSSTVWTEQRSGEQHVDEHEFYAQAMVYDLPAAVVINV